MISPEQLRRYPFFGGLMAEELASIAMIAEEVSYPDGAAIFRDGSSWFIEDLGSSNGTWHRRERIDRRRIADGDEFFVCSEKIRCVLR